MCDTVGPLEENSMKTRRIILHVHFSILFIAPFIVALTLLALMYGCQKKPAETKQVVPAVTIENLQIAYGKSVKHQHMYSVFAVRADKEHLKNVANLYRAASRSEQIHADNHAALIRQHGAEPKEPPLDSLSVGTTLQSLKMALSSEEIETESMYPNLIRTAALEKDSVAMKQFELTLDADNRQKELLKDAFDKNTKIQPVPYFVCGGCGYILTSDKTDECPGCHCKKEKFVKI